MGYIINVLYTCTGEYIIIKLQEGIIKKVGGLAMLNNRRAFSLILVIVLIFTSMTVFAGNNGNGKGKEKGKVGIEDIDLSGLKWVEGPNFGEVKNKKFEVHGKLQIPKEFKGTTIVKLEVNGFNVVPKKDGSFSKSVFINSEVDIKVFVGKDEVVDLGRTLFYLEDDTNRVDKVVAMIEALPNVEDLELSDRVAVKEARLAYEALTDLEKKEVRNLNKLIAAEERIAELEEKGNVHISLFKDATVASDGVDFEYIKDSFYIKNKETGEKFSEGTSPWNAKRSHQMKDIPVGEYTIHFDVPEGMYIHKIQLGEAYKETIYDPEINPLVVVDKGSTANYVKIILRSKTILKEIKPLDDLIVPMDITYEEFKDALPKQATIVDSNNIEHQVELGWDIRPFNFDNYSKPGETTLWSKFFKLPLKVSNTIPGTRLEVKLRVFFTY